MTQPNDTLAAPQPKLDDPPSAPQVNITLGTSVSGTVITITGNGAANIPQGQAATHFNFTLNDTSGHNVQFGTLDAEDNSTSCPPNATGNQSSQIVGVTVNNVPSNNKTARFTDNNSNQGQMNISYQWNFTCDQGYTVQPFDPVISNGGKSGPM